MHKYFGKKGIFVSSSYNVICLLSLFLILFLFTSEKQKDLGGQDCPFSKKEWQHTKEYYKSVGKGVSDDDGIARNIAVLSAKANLVLAIKKSRLNAGAADNVTEIDLKDVEIEQEDYDSTGEQSVCWVVIQIKKELVFSVLKAPYQDEAGRKSFIRKFDSEMKAIDCYGCHLWLRR